MHIEQPQPHTPLTPDQRARICARHQAAMAWVHSMQARIAAIPPFASEQAFRAAVDEHSARLDAIEVMETIIGAVAA